MTTASPQNAAGVVTTLTLDIEGEPILLEVRRDARLRTLGRWSVRGTTILLRVPVHTSRADIQKMIEDIQTKFARQRKRAKRRATSTDADLHRRAQEIIHEFFADEITFNSIRWVENMRDRLGSCTTGGPTDGDIRISTRIREWPPYVIDYVIAHELCHRKYPNHSPDFWAYLAHYPQAEKALGFIEGIGFAQRSGLTAEDPAPTLD